MDNVRLLEFLHKVVESSTPPPPPKPVWVQVLEAQTLQTEPAAWGKLFEAIRSDPDLRLFDDKLRQCVNSTDRVSYNKLTDWLILRASRVGPVKAVTDLQQYLQADQIRVTEIAAIAGLAVTESDVDLGRDIRLIPVDQLPESGEKTALRFAQAGDFGQILPTLTAALICHSVSPKKHLENPEATLSVPSRQEELSEACRILTLIGPCSPVCLAQWASFEDWVPCSNMDISMTGPVTEIGYVNVKTLTAEELRCARQLHESYAALDKPAKDRLRVPLDRLNQAFRRLNPADRAIDLGIALEAIFLDGERSELSFRMRVRAARWLGYSAEERRTLDHLVKRVYELRSTATHTGKIPSDTQTLQTLQTAGEMVARALKRIIREDWPDWNQVVLS